MYSRTFIKNIIKLFFIFSSSTVLAFSIVFIFWKFYNQPLGFKNVIDAYFYGLLLHGMVWFLVFIIGFLFQKILKPNNYKKSITISGLVLIVIFSLPLIFKSDIEFDIFEIAIYPADFYFINLIQLFIIDKYFKLI